MTEEQLQAIEERANAATPGPWDNRGDIVKDIAFEDDVIFYAADSMGPHIESGDWQTAVTQMRTDAAFIAHAREDVPALIAEVRALRSKLDAVPIDAIRAIYDSVPVNNWTRAPLKAIRQWLASLGKQVSL